jgi:branched-chain amino acid transport system permease protein
MKLQTALLVTVLPLLALWTDSSGLLVFIAGLVLINMLLASGLNLLYGFNGLIPFTFAGIAGISAFICCNLVLRAGWSFWTALPTGCVSAAVVGLVLSFPAIRLRGFYFALSGLVIQSALTIAFVYFPSFTNGDTGITSIPRPTFAGHPIASPWLEILVALASVLTLMGIAALMRSQTGSIMIAIREDEDLSRALGINVTANRSVAFLISSLIAGAGGGIYAHYVGFVSPRTFDVLISLNLWLMVAVGGRGTLTGPVLGALILTPLPFVFQQYSWVKDVIYGGAIVVVTLFLPQGLFGLLRQRSS